VRWLGGVGGGVKGKGIESGEGKANDGVIGRSYARKEKKATLQRWEGETGCCLKKRTSPEDRQNTTQSNRNWLKKKG